MKLTVDAVLRRTAQERPEHVFLRFAAGDLTFAEADQQVTALAHGLSGLGVRTGSRVALLMNNRVEFVLTWFAVNRLGGAVVPVNTQSRGPALARVLNTTCAALLVADAESLEPVLAVADRLDSLRHIVLTHPASPAAVPDRFATTSWSTLMLLGRGGDLPEVARPGDCALIMFTSGTTGPSKGCVLSHRFAVRQAQLLAENFGLGADDVLYCPFPLFHLDAAILTVMPAVVLGATAAIGTRFSATGFWDEIRQFRATVFDFMGATLTMLHKRLPRDDDADNPVRLAWGVPVPGWAADFERRFGLRLVELYGSTDIGVPIYQPLGEARRSGSCGRAIPQYAARIVGDDDVELPRGGVGEIVVRPLETHLITDGYLDMPAETGAAARNSWWHTGDLGRQDAEGWFYFVGRMTDSIRRRGENISAFEIEEVVKAHVDVLDAAAYPVPSELTEDDVMVAVVPRPGHTVRVNELLEFCAEHMAAYMVPRYVDVLDDLPRTPTAKVSKQPLIDRGVTATTYDRG